MCGICGICEPGAGTAHLATVEAMVGALRHRGPDGVGTLATADLAMGMCRLSIIDLAGGAQPTYSEDGRVAVVFNGEIYNYRELTQRLRQRGHVFASAADTEVIVHLYEELGDDCLAELRGMFAFALWDRSRQRLLLARDRLGIKPLYYADRGGRLAFASELKALLCVPGLEARLDLEALSLYLGLRYVPAPHTLFAGLRSLPPGHLLTWQGGRVEVRRWWDVPYPEPGAAPADEGEAGERLEQLLLESVRLRLRSDVPFGAFLSGGVDSSLVVALMSRLLDEPVRTYSVGFDADGDDRDELAYARFVARRFGTDHHEVRVRPRDMADLAERLVWHLDQPIADQATIAVFLLSRLAAADVKMVLTGEGGDELFAGYARYAGERLAPLTRRLPAPLRALAVAAGERLPWLDRRRRLALRALTRAEEPERLADWFALFHADARHALLTEDLRRRPHGTSAAGLFAEHLARTRAGAPLDRMLYVDTKLWLPDYLLLRGDKLTMSASLEARVPLLDHRLVEFAAALPPRFKLRGLTRKYLLRQVAARWLPPEIIQRRKQGFPIPLFRWFRHELRPFVRDLLSPEAVRRRGLFDARRVQRLVAEHESGRADHGLYLCGLVNVELWHRVFLDTPAAVAPASAVAVGERAGRP